MKKNSTLLFALFFLFFSSQAQLVVFGDDYAPGVGFVAFGGSVNNLSIDNAVKHSGTSSLKIPVTTGYTGGALVSAAMDVSAYNVLSFWAKNDMPAFKFDGAGLGNPADGTTVFALEVNGITLSAVWTKYYIPLPVPSKLTALTGLFHFAEGSGEGAYNIWIDDIQFETAAPGVIGTHTASFATETQAKAVGETFGANGTTSIYKINGVDQQMQTAKSYFTWLSSNTTVATFDNLGVGTANAGGQTKVTGKLGLVDAGGELTVNVTAPLATPAAAAPAPPARNASDVISLFTGVYADLAGTDWNPNWGQSTAVSEVNIVGNPTKKYTNLNYQGVQFQNPIDASAMTKLHFDVWTPHTMTLKFFPIVPGQPETAKLLNPTPNQWVSYDIDLATIGTSPLNNIIQFKFESDPFGGTTVYLDNIYFFKGNALPVTLSDFNVTKRGNTSVLNWNTLSEVNSKGFYVERSSNGSEFTALQFVNASNRLTSVKQYSIVDQTPLNGTNYYRLKQVDNDGKVSYSNIVSLKFSTFGLSAFSFYPNPAKTKITVLLQTINSRSASVQLTNAEGRMVRNVIINNQSSGSNINIDIANLAKGLYFLTLKDGPVVQTTKVIIN